MGPISFSHGNGVGLFQKIGNDLKVSCMGNVGIADGRTEISGKAVVGGLGVLLVVVIGMALAFAVGVVETLGYESRVVSGNGLTSTKSGYSLGLKTFYFTKGQEYYVMYDSVIQKGALIVHLYKMGSMPTSDTPYHRKISESGKGTVRFPIQESGWYGMSFSGSVLGAKHGAGRYDLSYQIRWGIR